MQTVNKIPEVGCLYCQPVINKLVELHQVVAWSNSHRPKSTYVTLPYDCDACGATIVIASNCTQIILAIGDGSKPATFRLPQFNRQDQPRDLPSLN